LPRLFRLRVPVLPCSPCLKPLPRPLCSSAWWARRAAVSVAGPGRRWPQKTPCCWPASACRGASRAAPSRPGYGPAQPCRAATPTCASACSGCASMPARRCMKKPTACVWPAMWHATRTSMPGVHHCPTPGLATTTKPGCWKVWPSPTTAWRRGWTTPAAPGPASSSTGWSGASRACRRAVNWPPRCRCANGCWRWTRCANTAGAP